MLINIPRFNTHLPKNVQALKRSKMQAGTNHHLSEAQATEEEGRMKRQNRQLMKQELIFHQFAFSVAAALLNLASQFLIIWNISL